MTIWSRLCGALVVLGLLLSRLSASAQTVGMPDQAALTVPERAQHLTTYLTDALRLNARQAAKLRAALQKRLDSAEMLGHLLFTSSQAAEAAYENLDYRYYAVMGKVLTPMQFHLFLQLDEPVMPADAPMMVQKR